MCARKGNHWTGVFYNPVMILIVALICTSRDLVSELPVQHNSQLLNISVQSLLLEVHAHPLPMSSFCPRLHPSTSDKANFGPADCKTWQENDFLVVLLFRWKGITKILEALVWNFQHWKVFHHFRKVSEEGVTNGGEILALLLQYKAIRMNVFAESLSVDVKQ